MPTAITCAPRLYRWVVVMALAVGMVVMHHVVGTHAHPGGFGNGVVGMTMLSPGVESCCGQAPLAGGTVAARPAQPGPDGGPMLHPCLAVLSGLALLAALVLTWPLTQAPEPGLLGAGRGRRAGRQRAPPIPLRLAQLGVLRL